jgi:hypothetical protein
MPDIQAAMAALPLPSAEINLGGTSTSELQFLTASAQNGVAAGTVLTCYLPGSNVLKNRPVMIRVGGRVTSVGTVTYKLYTGNSTTISSNVNIASSGALTPGSTGAMNWGLEVQGCIDTTSNTFNGLIRGGWAGNATAVAMAKLTTTASVTAANASSTLPLSITCTFGTGLAANQCFVDWFEVIPM